MHEKQGVSPVPSDISNVSLLSHSAHITEVCEQSLLAFILSERWNDLSTNATYYKQFLTKKVTN